MGFTCLDHCHPGWNVARPTPPSSKSTNSSWPAPSLNGRTSSAASRPFFTRPAITVSLCLSGLVCVLTCIADRRWTYGFEPTRGVAPPQRIGRGGEPGRPLALAEVSTPLGCKGADDVEVAELRLAVNDFAHAFGDPGRGGVLGVHHRLVVGRELHHLDVGAGVLAVSADDVPSSSAFGANGREPLLCRGVEILDAVRAELDELHKGAFGGGPGGIAQHAADALAQRVVVSVAVHTDRVRGRG